MTSLIIICICLLSLIWIVGQRKHHPAPAKGEIDAIVPAFNEETCISGTIKSLLRNPYVHQVIVVNDGSTDRTAQIVDTMAATSPRVRVVHQRNAGKGSALMAGLAVSTAKYVYLTDADTRVPWDDHGLGYMIAEVERGADAVGGIALSDLNMAGFLPHIRASTKLACIAIMRTFQQLLGGHPFLISGACGLFKREVLLDVPFSDRTKVEDLDLTWSLISKGYKIRQASRAFVYSQECNSLKSEWMRWRRWIAGYAVCMRLHAKLLPTRFGMGTILPVFLTSFLASGLVIYSAVLLSIAAYDSHAVTIFAWLWLGLVLAIGCSAAVHYKKPALILLAPLSLVYVAMSSGVWLIHGLRSLISGSEPTRDKPTRYVNVVA